MELVIRRFWVSAVTAAAVALLAAGVAWAGGHRYVGTVWTFKGANGTVNFTTKTSRGHLVVVRFTFDYVPANCSAGPPLQGFHFSWTFAVKRGRFHGHTLFGNPTIVVVGGRFNKNLSRATGTLRMRGSIGPHTGCDTGTLRWSALRR